jgi:mannan endo-1,4-beta-mannosidase
LAGALVGAGLSVSVPVADPSTLSMRDECATALTYPSRSPADVEWLNRCVSALTAPTVGPTTTPTAGPTATPTPTPTPTVQPSVPPATAPTYRTAGRYLLDPQGARVVVRGPEQASWQSGWLSPSFVTEIGRSGANTVRILPTYLRTPVCCGPAATLGQIEDAIRRGITAHMLVDVAIDGGQDYTVYLRPEVKALLLKYEKWIVIHAKGESYEASDTAWATDRKQVVAQLRAAGYRAPLYLMSRQGGRNLPTLLAKGAEVVSADPLHNVVFGWQAYWGSNNGYQNQYACPTSPCTLPMAMAAAAAAPFPIQVGLIYHSDIQDGSPQTVPYSNLMRLAQELQLGWLWWDWRMTQSEQLTYDGIYGHWTTLGQAVVVSDPNSIQRTSVRTAFQQSQVAP